MGTSVKLKEAYDIESKHGAFYTGGHIQWIDKTLYCQTEEAINLLNIENGTVIQTIGSPSEAEEVDTIQTFTTDGDRYVSSHKSGLLKLWKKDGNLEKMWKYIHKGPIVKLSLSGSQLASGGSDSSVRIWNLEHQACIQALKGCQGVVNIVEYHPYENTLLASADDGKINCYDLANGQLKTVHDAHYSKVTSIAFAHDKEHFISCGRDKVIVLWQFYNGVPLKTIAVYEVVEAIISLPIKFKLPGFKSEPDGLYVASAGEIGVVRVWDVKKSKEVFVQSNSLISKSSYEGGLAVMYLLYNADSGSIAVVSAEHNIVIYHLKSFACLKQFVGFSDDILDIVLLGKDNSHFAVATNSADIKLYDNASMNCQLVKGHEDLVLSLAVCPMDKNLMVSSGKDNSVRLWQLDGGHIRCIGVGRRHTGSVSSVTFFQSSRCAFVSSSQDTCLKLWDIPSKETQKSKKIVNLDEKTIIACKQTVIAHQKEINCVAVSPNDKIIASASQDKTLKLWSCDNLELIGTLKGHKRGVWSVRFSPVDQVAVSSSADCSIKLWSVATLNCLKTFEGHESSVLKAEFLSNGLQILSAGADGLVKIFNIKNSECECTLDHHQGRIWALALKTDETGFITGGSDSYLIKWKDVTEERKLERQKEQEELALIEQKLSNYIQSEQLLKALKLALKLERPLQTLKIIQGIIKKGEIGLKETITALRNDQKESLLNCALNWNMNSKNCHPAQLVFNVLLNELQAGDFRPVGLNKMVESALPYTERHFKRLTQMLQDVHFLSYTVNIMQPNARNVNIGE
ncbi:transducin beta-like protein 3 [Euwallacea similis]|uniref:transducin beta-like protein 3 n=1 Tax=Euwallacea similis TaxID=1736056 RepID=UPI00344DE972